MKPAWRCFQAQDILAQRLLARLSRAAAALGWGRSDRHARETKGMTIQAKLLCAVAVSGFAALAVTSPAQALTTQECSAKYQAAKAAGTLAGQKWNDFRKAQCGAGRRGAPPRPPACRPGCAEGGGSQPEEGTRACRGPGGTCRSCSVP